MAFYLPNSAWTRVGQTVGQITIKAFGCVRVAFSGTEPDTSDGTNYSYHTCKPTYDLDGGGLDMWVKSFTVGPISTSGHRNAIWIDGAGTFIPDDILPTPQFVGMNDPLTGAAPSESFWQGHVTTGSLTCSIKVQPGDEVYFVASTGPFLTSSPKSTTVLADTFGVAKATITGMSPGTTYYTAAVVNGDLTAVTGSVTTVPIQPSPIKFTLGSCRNTDTDNAIWTTMGEEDADFFFHMGDIHYRDISTNSRALFETGFDEPLNKPRQGAIYRSTASYYMFDDHDYGPNDSDGSSPSRQASLNTFRAKVPTPALATSGALSAVNYTFRRGKLVFAVLDLRSQRSGTDFLGPTQEAWFEGVVQSLASDDFLCIVSTVPWIASSGSDTWYDASAQRARLAQMVTDNCEGRAFIISGDMHALAFDDGTNSVGGIPVFHASPLTQNTSSKGGPYTIGPIRATNTQYGVVEFNSLGDTATVRYIGYSVDAVGNKTSRIDETLVLETPVPVDPTPGNIGVFASGASAHGGNQDITTLAASLDSTVAGNLQVASGGPDKGATVTSVTAGFTASALNTIDSVGATSLVYYRESGGTGTDFTTAWDSPQKAHILISEYAGGDGTWELVTEDVNLYTGDVDTFNSPVVSAQAGDLVVGVMFKESSLMNKVENLVVTSDTMTEDHRIDVPTSNNGTPLSMHLSCVSTGGSHSYTVVTEDTDAGSAWIGVFRFTPA